MHNLDFSTSLYLSGLFHRQNQFEYLKCIRFSNDPISASKSITRIGVTVIFLKESIQRSKSQSRLIVCGTRLEIANVFKSYRVITPYVASYSERNRVSVLKFFPCDNKVFSSVSIQNILYKTDFCMRRLFCIPLVLTVLWILSSTNGDVSFIYITKHYMGNYNLYCYLGILV